MKRTALIALLLTVIASAPAVHGYVVGRTVASNGQIVVKKWAAFPIPWRLNPVKGGNVTGGREFGDVIRAAFQAWQAIPTSAITFVEGQAVAPNAAPGYDQVNLVSTNLSPADFLANGGGTGVLALAAVYFYEDVGTDEFGRPITFPGQILETDVLFNPDALFSTDQTTPSNRTDFQQVATHEFGHLLGLDHTSFVNATMFPSQIDGTSFGRQLSSDDMIGVSTLYPAASFATKGTLNGTVRTITNTAVYGAIVVAVNASGIPVASAITDTSGRYSIAGLDPGNYTVYAEPIDSPLTPQGVATFARIFPGVPMNTNFTTRFR